MFFSPLKQTVHRCSRAHVVLVQRCINEVLKSRKCLVRGLSSEGAKCRIESPPHAPARSGLLTAVFFFFICYKLCGPVIRQFKDKVMSALGCNKPLSLRPACVIRVFARHQPEQLNLHAKALCTDNVACFLKIEGDTHTQCDLLLLTTENFLPADRGAFVEGGQLVLALHQAGGETCSTPIVGVSTTADERV